MAGWEDWAGLGEQCVRCRQKQPWQHWVDTGGTSYLWMRKLGYRGPTVLCLLYKRLGYRWILVTSGGPGTNPLWILRADCISTQQLPRSRDSKGNKKQRKSEQQSAEVPAFWAECTELFSRKWSTCARVPFSSLWLAAPLGQTASSLRKKTNFYHERGNLPFP